MSAAPEPRLKLSHLLIAAWWSFCCEKNTWATDSGLIHGLLVLPISIAIRKTHAFHLLWSGVAEETTGVADPKPFMKLFDNELWLHWSSVSCSCSSSIRPNDLVETWTSTFCIMKETQTSTGNSFDFHLNILELILKVSLFRARTVWIGGMSGTIRQAIHPALCALCGGPASASKPRWIQGQEEYHCFGWKWHKLRHRNGHNWVVPFLTDRLESWRYGWPDWTPHFFFLQLSSQRGYSRRCCHLLIMFS